MNAQRAHILYFVTEDWFFCSHFIERAIAARQAGYQVSVLTRVRDHGERIRAAGPTNRTDLGKQAEPGFHQAR